MLNQNARRTGAAGVIARALATLGAATLLLTSTGWGALAGDTGFGAVNLKAYMGAAAAAMAPGSIPRSPVPGSFSGFHWGPDPSDDYQSFRSYTPTERATAYGNSLQQNQPSNPPPSYVPGRGGPPPWTMTPIAPVPPWTTTPAPPWTTTTYGDPDPRWIFYPGPMIP